MASNNNVMFYCVLLLYIFFADGYENHFNADQRISAQRERRSVRSAAEVSRKDLYDGQSRSGDLFLRRRDLKQTADGDCTWNSEANACQINFPVLLDLLDDMDTPVSNFVHKELVCQQAEDQNTCEDLECLWSKHDGTCSYTIEDYRNVHSNKCMDKARYITDLAAGTRECMLLDTKETCLNEKKCFWIQEACHFDKWYYYHGINTRNGYPEAMDELVDVRTHEVALGVHKAMDEGEIISHTDIIDWQPPAFDCPEGHEEVVCNYVDAFTPFFLQTLSCGLHNPTDCSADPSCSYNFVRGCSAAAHIFLRQDQAAEFVFAKGIKDKDASNFEVKVAECIYMTEEDECKDREGCQWLESLHVCSLSRKWEQLEAHRLVGNTTEPVCEFFTVDLSSGCIDIEDKDKCEADASCMYVDASENCVASVTGQAFHALSSSKQTSKDLNKAVKTCGVAKTKTACKAISM